MCGRKIIRIRIIRITRFDCVWLQTQKSPSDPISEFGHVDAKLKNTKIIIAGYSPNRN
jgi:hypothetical protein